ncbi:Y-family DNA polymerase [Enterovibrio paralichthyis]|uniref:Y-family DNA polymerase n=1 Tax=Enterovibrio paralichthyis TaxID=2853805 RepID=UPI001C489515|nr:DNA polymerase Y family protein [Enterovibrio paralichthyis]MBV7297302.1 DNA polymerase Y family protein [Enterovibrio paralichthyis]
MMLWLYLHFPALLLDTLVRDNAVKTPLVVLSHASGQVCQANTQAREFGIQTGNDLGTASALCHGLQVADYDEQAETARLHQLATLLYQVSADIFPYPPDGLLIKVSPMLKLYGSLDNYWHHLLPVLAAESVDYHFALSPFPEAARQLARAGADRGFLTAETTKEALSALGVHGLGLTPKQVLQLERMGIRQASQLFSLPLDSLGQRFGKPLTAHLRGLTESITAQQTSFRPPEHFHQSLELMHEIANSQTLCFPLQRMLKEMEKFLHVREAVTPSIVVVLTQREQEDKVLEISAAAPESAASRWMSLLQLHLEKLKLDAPVTHLRLDANILLPRQSPTQDLFAGKRGQLTPEELVSLMQAKAGKEGVYSLTLQNDHRPERAFRRQLPFEPCQQTLPTHLPARPAVLHTAPRPLFFRPELLTPPERISGGWWDKSPVQRDYFVARNKRGQLCWVFRTATGEWFEHGLFC